MRGRLPRGIADYRKDAANARRVASRSDEPAFWMIVADALGDVAKNGMDSVALKQKPRVRPGIPLKSSRQ